MAKILIYGFKPFAEYETNITEKIINEIPETNKTRTHVFKVKFDQGMFHRVLNRTKPDLIIGMGQHPRARKLRIEKKAVNLMQGPEFPEKKIRKNGSDFKRVSYHLPQMDETTITYDAGTYVCNFSMYEMAEYCEINDARFAFIHVPLNFSVADCNSYLRTVTREY